MFVYRSSFLLSVVIFLLFAVLIYSGITPYNRTTWFMEVIPVIVVLPLLWITRMRYPLTPLLYTLIFLYALILLAGGMYSYARVPLGFSIQEWLGLSRNPYDKLGLFFQGMVPALAAREILIRGSYVQGRKMLCFISCCIAIATSVIYELFEWRVALMLGYSAEAFLGMQGDPWDTQSDMLFALLGAVCGLFLFGHQQRRQITRFCLRRMI